MRQLEYYLCHKRSICKCRPIDLSNNVTFLMANSSFKNAKDIAYDNMGFGNIMVLPVLV